MKKRKGREQSRGLRARAWWVIRKNRVTTLPELLLTLNDNSHKDPANNLGIYLRRLTSAGLLNRRRVADGKLTSNGIYQYRLVRDVGPKPPVCRKEGVYDPNTGQLLPEKTHD